MPWESGSENSAVSPYAKLLSLVDGIVANLQRIPSGFSGDDSGLTDFWLEYACQVQEEHSVLFGEYEHIIREECDREAVGLPAVQVVVLWPATEGYLDWGEDDPPALLEKREHISDELHRLVQRKAADLDLPG
jgi:hypothetical protein